MKEYPEDLKSKAYLLTHFERYMMERLYGDQEYTFEDIERSKGMDFVVKYLRMKHVIVFRMSHDTLQASAHVQS
jgi:cell cycle serine/threonine-protein kinase CDC5/MSD2